MDSMHESAPTASSRTPSLEDFTRETLCDAFYAIGDLTETAVALLFRISGYEKGYKGVCCAKAATLAEKIGCSTRTIRRRLAELEESGLIDKVRRRKKMAERVLTPSGKAAVVAVLAGGQMALWTFLQEPVSAHVSAPIGEAESIGDNYSRKSSPQTNVAAPKKADPHSYTLPRRALTLTARAWKPTADWLSTLPNVSYARCKMANKRFAVLARSLGKLSTWGVFMRRVWHKHGIAICAEDLVRMAIEDAVKRGRPFGTVESAGAYIRAIAVACVREGRLPGEGLN